MLRSIKELEFDRAMGKVSPRDFDEMAARLRARAMMLIKQADEGGAGYRELIERELSARLVTRARAGTAEPHANRRSRGDNGAWNRSASGRTKVESVAAPVLHRVRHRQRPRRRVLQAMWRTPRCGDGVTRSSLHIGRLVAVLVLAAGFYTPVAAQPFAGGMPDPKQMSGRPLPVGDLPVGTVTVRVVRGSMTNVVANQAVELTGAARPLTATTNAQGRAEFPGLRRV